MKYEVHIYIYNLSQSVRDYLGDSTAVNRKGYKNKMGRLSPMVTAYGGNGNKNTNTTTTTTNIDNINNNNNNNNQT